MPYKDLNKRREYNKNYQRKWKQKNKERFKEIAKKSESRPERKEYIKKWWKESPKAKQIRKRFQESEKSKKYQKDWNEKNKDKLKLKYQKYCNTNKGVLNQIKKVQNRRTKFKKIAGVYYNLPGKDLIEYVDKRDKKCIYCRCKFSKDKNSVRYRTYDHVDAFKPHSKTNTVKCCSSCNSSKGDKDVLQWMESKGYKPNKIIYSMFVNS